MKTHEAVSKMVAHLELVAEGEGGGERPGSSSIAERRGNKTAGMCFSEASNSVVSDSGMV